MEDHRMIPHDQASMPRQRKMKRQGQDLFLPTTRGEDRGFEISRPSVKPPKGSSKTPKHEASPSLQASDRSTSDPLQDSSKTNVEYHALRRKYLLLEEESCAVGKELNEVEEKVKTLEDEKLALLDQLVVLEGLISPSELQMCQGS